MNLKRVAANNISLRWKSACTVQQYLTANPFEMA